VAPAPASRKAPADPKPDCKICPRLVAYRDQTRGVHADWFNGAVPSFGDAKGRMAIIGLAPGVSGANRTGRPFTGDYAGDLLYATLGELGFVTGTYKATTDDGLRLIDCMITNAVRCVPPENKPTPDEINKCRPHLMARLAAMPNLQVLFALGRIAHESCLKALGAKTSAHPFAHGAHHQIGSLHLVDSYHCSRYNTNTGRLTVEMFRAAMTKAADLRIP
jgi:uracil-DNA glycosylase family 4